MFEAIFRYTHIYTISPHGQNQDNRIDIKATKDFGKRISQWNLTCFSYAMQGCASEGTRFEFPKDWRTVGYAPSIGQQLGKTLPDRGYRGSENQSGTRTQANYWHGGRGNHPTSNRKRSFKRFVSQGTMGSSYRQDSMRGDSQTFFKRIGARFGRIRKRPKGKPSPQLYQYKLWELQELEPLWYTGTIDLYYGDESHLCEETYVPYGWKFSKEDVYIPSQCGKCLNCFAMIDRRCRTHWFTTENRIDANSIISYLDDFSLTIERKTVIVLDNAPIHGARKLLELRPLWEKRGLHIFFLPPYSPHLNIAEILWPLLKGKWLQPRDYLTSDTLFYAANRALETMGDGLMINFRNHAA